MGFFIFRLDELICKHQRGIIPDVDIVTFSVFVNGLDRGHGSSDFVLGSGGSSPAVQYDSDSGALSNIPRNRLNMNTIWWTGPFEIHATDIVAVVYTGVNTSDDNNTSVQTEKQDKAELKILDYVAKKYVELITGTEFGDDIGSALSDAFDKAIADPIGDLIGYKPQGPCNGPVFSGVVTLTGNELLQLQYTPLGIGGGGSDEGQTPMPTYKQASQTHSYTDEATHDTGTCGAIAETDVVFSILEQSFISLTWSLSERFPIEFRKDGNGLRKYAQPHASFSVKQLLGVLP